MRFGVFLVVSIVAVSAQADDEPTYEWASLSTSGTRLSDTVLTDREAELQSKCGVSEVGLRRVAERLVLRKSKNLPMLDLDGLTFAERASGEPHVWPRAWIVSGRAMDHESTVAKLDAWRRTFHDIGERRCGVASGYAADGTQVVAAVALDALADLTTPIPTRTHPGTWLAIEARMLVPSRAAHVVIVGPSGEPRTVPSSYDGSHVRARFAPERAGAFTVQIVADVATGPRPVLEAQVFADAEPPHTIANRGAPGESAGVGAGDERDALARMVAALRTEQGLPALHRDGRLDVLALAHAQRMKARGTIGHDVGDGDPAQRLQNANISAPFAGENVAHAATLALAHRALWQSPSHRENLQSTRFDAIGFAVVSDADGSVWVTELFAKTQ